MFVIAALSLDDLASLAERMAELASSPPVEMNDIAKHLHHIAAQLRSGTLSCGVIGLTKAGKSMTLNALLGNAFLPNSLQPQTAKEVSIIHDPMVVDGALYTIHEESKGAGEQELVASGVSNVLEYLFQINEDVRKNNATIPKLLLRASFPFLTDTKRVQLEVSDTPGLFEATANENITAESKIVVKEQFAFVLILNLKLLKTKGESELLRMLSSHHPEILVKLNRILVLVNAYDYAFHNMNPESLRPDAIPQYVSEYLSEPGILNVTILAENILPYSALWALRARQWMSDPLSLIDSPDAGNLYEEAMIILRRAGFDKEVEPMANIGERNVKAVAQYLLKFSNIETIEARLKEMLEEQGPRVLREAAVEDSMTIADRILNEITRKIDDLELSKKEATVIKLEELITTLKEFEKEHISRIHQMSNAVQGSITSEISSVMGSIRGAVDTAISTQLMNHLQGYDKVEDRNVVFARICQVKDLINQPALNELTKGWHGLKSIARNTQIESIRRLYSELKSSASSLLVVEPSVANDMPIIANLVSSLLPQLVSNLDSVDVMELVPNLDAMNLQIDARSIPNAQLDHIWNRMATKYRTEARSKKKKSGFLGLKRKRVTWYESVPYQVPIHGPDLDALRNVFTTQATKPWMANFNDHVHTAITGMSKVVSEQVRIMSSKYRQL